MAATAVSTAIARLMMVMIAIAMIDADECDAFSGHVLFPKESLATTPIRGGHRSLENRRVRRQGSSVAGLVALPVRPARAALLDNVMVRQKFRPAGSDGAATHLVRQTGHVVQRSLVAAAT